MEIRNWNLHFVDIWRKFSKSEHKKFCVLKTVHGEFRIDKTLLFRSFYTYVNFFVHSRYEFRDVFNRSHNWTRNFSTTKRVT